MPPGREPDPPVARSAATAPDDALRRLETFDARKAQILELRYFGGLAHDEIAAVMKLSASAVAAELGLRSQPVAAAAAPPAFLGYEIPRTNRTLRACGDRLAVARSEEQPMRPNLFSRVLRGALTAALLAAGGAAYAECQPSYGCLSNGTCGRGICSPRNTPDDFWHNWICTECHVGPASGLRQSPTESTLAASPGQFWSVHAQATRDAATRQRAASYRALKAERELAPAFRALTKQRPTSGG